MVLSRAEKGFSLLEMLVVLAIIGIVIMATIPSGGGKIDQAGISETINLVKRYQPQIEQFYMATGEFPIDNDAAGLPDPESIIGNYLQATYVDSGAIHVELGNKIRPELKGKIISLRPIFVPDAENSPISWVCGLDTIPENMVAAGENRTDVEAYRLPMSCR
ncbi:MAG: pilin [Halieaceae bacterium]